MKTKFKDVAHLYPNVQIEVTSIEDNQKHIDTIEAFVVGESICLKKWGGYYFEKDELATIKPILKPITDITEDDFRGFATSELLGINDRMAFDFDRYLWRACSYEFEGHGGLVEMTDGNIIDEINENDCGRVLMLHRPSMSISEGWLSDGETYSGCDLKTTARWIAFLCSRCYNVFGLDESEIITKTK